MNLFRLIRGALRVSNWRADQKSVVDTVSKVYRAGNGHPKRGHRLKPIGDFIVRCRFDQACSKHDIDKTAVVSDGRANLKKNNWGFNHSVNRDEWTGGSVGLLCHDGSYQFFKWDSVKGCMVPSELSNQTLSRTPEFDEFWLGFGLL
jgi:hypothetical protein